MTTVAGGPNLVHCSYHKCLTVYFKRVVEGLLHDVLRDRRGRYRHFDQPDPFYEQHREYRVASINNRRLDLDRLGDFRVTRFIRDPRDLVVSGYHYHRRGAEAWCHVPAGEWPGASPLPAAVRAGESYAAFLGRVPVEEGLVAEMDLVRRGLLSMREWPDDDPRIRVFRYEHILGHETDVFGEVFAHYGMAWPERALGRLLARRYRAARRGRDPHVRDHRAGQWTTAFTPTVRSAFVERFGDLPEALGYPPSGVPA